MKIKKENLSRDSAAEAFIQDVITDHCYDSLERIVKPLLNNGPDGHHPDPKEIAWHRFFMRLSKEDQEKVFEIVGYAVDLSLFILLNVLDGSAPLSPVEEQISGYALYLQTYRNDEDEKYNRPDKVVLINEIYPKGDSEYLHDLFSYAMNDKRAEE